MILSGINIIVDHGRLFEIPKINVENKNNFKLNQYNQFCTIQLT